MDKLFHLLQQKGSNFFSVTFSRRTADLVHGKHLGDDVTFICRTGVRKYTKGVESDEQRAAADFKHAVLTVWSITDYVKMREHGFTPRYCGENAFRRIDLTTVKECSLLHRIDLPPVFNPYLHELTNQYRRNNIPREMK